METLCKIRDLYRAIAEFETRFEKAHHLCLNEGMLLCCLSRKKRLSSGEIAEQLGLSNSNTSKVIRSVEDKGYIEWPVCTWRKSRSESLSARRCTLI